MTNKEVRKKVIGGMLIRLTFDGSLQRAKIYRKNVSDKRRKEFRDYMSVELPKIINGIEKRENYNDNNHYKTIEQLSHRVTKNFKDILDEKRLRIGNTQKFLNLYWKVAWLAKETSIKPIHCPFDSIIMKKLPKNARVPWTQFDTIEEYQQLVKAAKIAAVKHSSVADWEVHMYWNSSNGEK